VRLVVLGEGLRRDFNFFWAEISLGRILADPLDGEPGPRGR